MVVGPIVPGDLTYWIYWHDAVRSAMRVAIGFGTVVVLLLAAILICLVILIRTH